MGNSIDSIAFHQGISDWLRFKKNCPVYWRGKPEESHWKRGYNYARRYNH